MYIQGQMSVITLTAVIIDLPPLPLASPRYLPYRCEDVPSRTSPSATSHLHHLHNGFNYNFHGRNTCGRSQGKPQLQLLVVSHFPLRRICPVRSSLVRWNFTNILIWKCPAPPLPFLPVSSFPALPSLAPRLCSFLSQSDLHVSLKRFDLTV
ncbi:hypothetical protein E2C01_051667 [Portunus trituberculatus]|uniref:Uncharacterized protein n=1 Tax=Portunus trituberculatus TaxID=210409 RepID=A0A5B7GBM4_PORTR|nr:hypothetical protein [Portunus trituberculatus]